MDIKHLQKLLYRSLDESLNPSEKEALQNGLAHFPTLQEEQEHLIKMRHLLSEVKIDQSPQFVNTVLTQLNPIRQEATIVQLFPRVAAACILFFTIVFLTFYLGDLNLGAEVLVGVDEVSIDDAYAFLDE